MRIAFINAVPYGSTGNITKNIAKLAKDEGNEVLIYFGWTKKLHKSNDKNIVIGSFLGKLIHMIMARITGYNGCFSVIDTFLLISKLKKFKPDIINMHILHSWYVNLPMLFKYIKDNNISVVWTMHDCWAFTGQCPAFEMIKCDKWKSRCFKCPQYRIYPESFVDKTKKMYKLKKKWFNNVDNMTLVTPSKWLADLIKQSYLMEYPVKVINNGIDLDIFKPTQSDFKKKYNIENKKIVLGVAFDWGIRKGLDVFANLAKKLDNDKYQVVLVGTDEKIKKQLPKNIITINRTAEQKELAEIYSAADVFVNPTREDNYPTVNMEAIACGTPVITFAAGGSAEIISENTGYVCLVDDIEMMVNLIEKVVNNKEELRMWCIKDSVNFNKNDRFKEYIQVFSDKGEKEKWNT